MLTTNVIQEYGLSDDFVRKFCNAGCSVECGRILEKRLKRMGKQRRAEGAQTAEGLVAAE